MKTHIYEFYAGCGKRSLGIDSLAASLPAQSTSFKGGERLTLKELRENAGLQQADVGKKLQLDQSAISNWERGRAKPLRKYRRRLANLYKCSVQELEDIIEQSKITTDTVR